MLRVFVFTLLICGTWCQRTEQILVSPGEQFSFDCKQDESVYFGQQLGQWSEIQENDDQYDYLNLKFNYLSNNNILRITSNAAQSQNVGYYTCRKSIRTTASTNRIYQVIIADVESFYWTYICHGPAGSCLRTDDPIDESLSRFEVADQTKVDLYCCAAATGYKNIDIKMTQIGEIRGKIDVKRQQELDGSWVVCANQHTLLKRTSSSRIQQTLTCELMIDNRPHSYLSSDIIIKEAITSDPNDDGYSIRPNQPGGRNRGKLSTGKKIAIILGSIIGGLLLLGVVFGLIFLLCCKKKASKNPDTNKSKEYTPVNTYEEISPTYQQNPKEDESGYLTPVPLYQNTPVVLRF